MSAYEGSNAQAAQQERLAERTTSQVGSITAAGQHSTNGFLDITSVAGQPYTIGAQYDPRLHGVGPFALAAPASQAREVHKGILAVMKRMGEIGIAKGREMDVGRGPKRAYRGIDDVYAALNGVLAENELIVVPSVESYKIERFDAPPNEYKKIITTHVYTFVINFEIISAKDGSSKTMRIVNESFDTSDKGSGKNYSYAWKSAALLLFQIPTEGQPDQDAHNPQIESDGDPQAMRSRREHDEREAAARREPNGGPTQYVKNNPPAARNQSTQTAPQPTAADVAKREARNNTPSAPANGEANAKRAANAQPQKQQYDPPRAKLKNNKYDGHLLTDIPVNGLSDYFGQLTHIFPKPEHQGALNRRMFEAVTEITERIHLLTTNELSKYAERLERLPKNETGLWNKANAAKDAEWDKRVQAETKDTQKP